MRNIVGSRMHTDECGRDKCEGADAYTPPNLPYFALLAVKPTCSFLHAFVGGGHKSPNAIDLKYTQQQP
jgi:hypothetical protein